MVITHLRPEDRERERKNERGERLGASMKMEKMDMALSGIIRFGISMGLFYGNV